MVDWRALAELDQPATTIAGPRGEARRWYEIAATLGHRQAREKLHMKEH